MKNRYLSPLLMTAIAMLLAGYAALAQPLTLTGTNYFQNFDGITANGLPPEWTVREQFLTPTSLGSLQPFISATTNTWTSTTGRFYNQASTTNNDGTPFTGSESSTNQAAATNRCVAVRVTAAFGDTNNTGGGVGFCLELANTTGYQNFNIALDFLLLNPQTRSNIWTVEYGFGASPTSFISVGSYTAATIAQGGVFGSTHGAFSFGGALDNQPGPVWIRIANDTIVTPPNLLSGGSGSRPMFGIDNVSLNWSVGTSLNPVVITSQPQNKTNDAETTATFTVGATGTAPTYQWFEVLNGVTNQLSDQTYNDGSQIVGSSSPTLQIQNVLGGEAGTYFATIANSVNTTNSALAVLSVNDPVITAQPQNQTNAPGDITYFDATVVGTQPFDLQWYYNGTLIEDQPDTFGNTNQFFVYVTNGPSWTNSAGFTFVASNSFGSATSSVVMAAVATVPPVQIGRWDFNETENYSATAPLPSVGNGTATALTAVTQTNFLFAAGAIADPAFITDDQFNEGWEVQDGPAQGTLNKQVGYQYKVSTAGYQGIVLTWQERHSASASKYMRVQYSTDGMNFVDGPVIAYSVVAYTFSQADLSGIAAINNNPNFAFRVVMEVEGTAINTSSTNYDGTSSTYGSGSSGGTIRQDLMTIWGSVQPNNPVLTLTLNGNNVVLTWTASGYTLQSSATANGTFADVAGAISGYSTPVSGAQQYFRLRSN